MSRTLHVSREHEGMRLDTWLSSEAGLSRVEAQRLISQGLVEVEGRVREKSWKLTPGVEVSIEDPPGVMPAGPLPSFEIRYQDDDLAVIAKPAGVLVHPAPGTRSQTLVDALGAVMPLAPAAGPGRPGVVHRLDKDTSGLLIVAKTDDAYWQLTRALRERKVERVYLTLVAGNFTMPTGRIEAPVRRSKKTPTRMSVTAGGRQAATEFRVMERIGPLSYLRVKLETGRTHQIRVHFSHIRRPVVGDRVYARGSRGITSQIGLNRPFLHAAELRFDHPRTGAKIEVVEALPEDLEGALTRARHILAEPSGGTRR